MTAVHDGAAAAGADVGGDADAAGGDDDGDAAVAALLSDGYDDGDCDVYDGG